MLPNSLINLINTLKKLPGIGEKSATRLAYHIIRSDKDYVSVLSEALITAKEKICECSLCRSFAESDPCDICSNVNRMNSICIVEKPQDLQAIEQTNEFKGKYFVLHGVLNPIEGIGPEDLKLNVLFSRIEKENITEIIVATNPSTEGETTAHYIGEKLKAFTGVKLSKIAYGLPIGGMLEYADKQTIGKALENRTPL